MNKKLLQRMTAVFLLTPLLLVGCEDVKQDRVPELLSSARRADVAIQAKGSSLAPSSRPTCEPCPALSF